MIVTAVLLASIAASGSASAFAWSRPLPVGRLSLSGSSPSSGARNGLDKRYPDLEALGRAVVSERARASYSNQVDLTAAKRLKAGWDGRVIEMDQRIAGSSSGGGGKFLGMTDMKTVFVASENIRNFDPKNPALLHHTVIHELAHIAAGKSDHGSDFQRQLCRNGEAAYRTPEGKRVKALYDVRGCQQNFKR